MPAPTVYTLAGKIAASELLLLHARTFGAFALDPDDYRARCDAELDKALDVAVLAVWEHTDPTTAAAEFGAAA